MELHYAKRKAGFTLIEILLVVGFISLAGIGIYTIYSKVKASNIALQEAKNLDTLRIGVKSLFAGKQNYEIIGNNGLNSVLNNARITPDSMRKIPYVLNDPFITNSFGGQVVVTTNIGITGFWIIYDNVPGDVCPKLVTSSAPAWDHIAMDSTWIKKPGTANLDTTALATACATDTGNGVRITYRSTT